jgi:hypothetical protein
MNILLSRKQVNGALAPVEWNSGTRDIEIPGIIYLLFLNHAHGMAGVRKFMLLEVDGE